MHAFDVLGDPVRRRILELLADGEHSSGEVVAVVQAEFGITQSAVSQHLKVLRDSRLRHGADRRPRRIYAMKPRRCAEVDAWLGPLPDILGAGAGRAGHRGRPRQEAAAAEA